MNALLLAAMLALAVAALAACGEKEESPRGADPQQLDVLLDFYVNPDHAGIYTALDRGYFDDAGLDVSVEVPSDAAAPIKLLDAGRADIAVTYEPEVFIARDQGLDVIAIAALVDEPLTSVIWTEESGVHGVDDLAGRTVVTAGIPYQTNFLEVIAEEAGIDPGSINVPDANFNLLPAVTSGSADAMLGGYPNVEGATLADRGLGPTVLPVDELGIPTYDELVLAARGSDIAENPEPYRLFVAALERGTAEAVSNAQAATQTIADAGYDIERALARRQTDATLPLLEPSAGEPYGHMEAAEWEEFGGFLYDEGVLSQRPVASEALTNEVLPGGIPEE